ADAVAEAFRRRASGASWKELAEYLEASGVVGAYGSPTWTTGAVSSVIANPVYTGQARSGPFTNDAAHPPIVSPVEWRAAQAARGVVSPLRSADGALLSGLLRCAGCRYVMKPDTIISRGEKLRQYRCRGEHAAGRCSKRSAILARVVEPYVVAAFFDALGPDGVLARPVPNRSDVEAARAALGEAEAEVADFVETVTIREHGRDAYARGLAARQRRQAEAQRAYDDAVAGSAIDGLPPVADLRALWPSLSTADQRRILAAGVDAVMLRRGRDLDLRLLVLWAGDAPDDLPRRGRRVPLAPFDWPDDRPVEPRLALAQ
ncbi:MAG: recombinase family protein, partial [Gaiellales bacterium]